MALERIQKILAAAGYGSRRDCEKIVLDGRVAVNGEIVDELPLLVDPESDQIHVDTRPLRKAKLVYLVLNKPSGVYCTMSSVEGRKTVGDFLAKLREPVMPVGRTDAECGGLVLLTNDKELAAQLGDPRRGVEKTYRVEVPSAVSPDVFSKLREGLRLSEGRTAPMRAKTIHSDRQRTILEIVTNDHLQREVPRVLAKLGLKVKRIMRIKFGKLSMRDIPVTAARMLAPEEIAHLKKAAAGTPDTFEPRPLSSRPQTPSRLRSGPKPARARAAPAKRKEKALPPARPRGEKKRRIIMPDE